jgi:hypothetical protein
LRPMKDQIARCVEALLRKIQHNGNVSETSLKLSNQLLVVK